MRSLSLRLLCGLCFLGASSGAFADYYRWPGSGANFFDDPQQACNDRLSALSWVPNADSASSQFVMENPPAAGRCRYIRNGEFYQSGNITAKLVTGCPAGQIEDPETKECAPPQEPPPDDCATRGPGIFSRSGPIISSDGKNYVAVDGGGSVCYGQCSHELSSSASSCYSSGDGGGFCNFIGTPSGATCSESDAPLGRTGDALNSPDTPDVPPSDPNDPGCPPGYGWSGTTCAQNPDDNGNPPGDGSGGDGGDTGDTVDTGDTGGGGGGGDGSGGDSGGGDTGGGDTGGGDTGGGDTGGGDTGGGVPGGGGSGDGSGDDGEEPVSSVGGESCSATITCEGDAIQCAILRSQKKQACADEEARDYSKAAPTINAEIGKGEYQLKEETVDASGFFNMGNRFYSSTCPAPQSLRIESFNRTIQLSYQPLCDFAGALSYIVVAMASLFFMVYVGRSFGGE